MIALHPVLASLYIAFDTLDLPEQDLEIETHLFNLTQTRDKNGHTIYADQDADFVAYLVPCIRRILKKTKSTPTGLLFDTLRADQQSIDYNHLYDDIQKYEEFLDEMVTEQKAHPQDDTTKDILDVLSERQHSIGAPIDMDQITTYLEPLTEIAQKADKALNFYQYKANRNRPQQTFKYPQP